MNLFQSEPWMARGACRGMDPSIFIPERRDQTTTDAKRVCASCPVRDECLEYGIFEPYGVWGGKTDNERRRIRSERHRARARVA